MSYISMPAPQHTIKYTDIKNVGQNPYYLLVKVLEYPSN